jgi:hypothetical protein
MVRLNIRRDTWKDSLWLLRHDQHTDVRITGIALGWIGSTTALGAVPKAVGARSRAYSAHASEAVPKFLLHKTDGGTALVQLGRNHLARLYPLINLTNFDPLDKPLYQVFVF